MLIHVHVCISRDINALLLHDDDVCLRCVQQNVMYKLKVERCHIFICIHVHQYYS
jgi:hypothetical protein